MIPLTKEMNMKEQLDIALVLAATKHHGQMYGNQPYLVHLYEVDKLVTQIYAKVSSPSEPFSKEPGDEVDKLRAIAFLHDIIEDTDTTREDLLNAGICNEVAVAVELLTRIDGGSYFLYIEAIRLNELARKVKLCDTSANLMNSIKEGNTKRINKYSKQIQLLGGF
jgi:(p)ppGpp synthase/HD superfamily hydrolase